MIRKNGHRRKIYALSPNAQGEAQAKSDGNDQKAGYSKRIRLQPSPLNDSEVSKNLNLKYQCSSPNAHRVETLPSARIQPLTRIPNPPHDDRATVPRLNLQKHARRHRIPTHWRGTTTNLWARAHASPSYGVASRNTGVPLPPSRRPCLFVSTAKVEEKAK
jgi:hypothetical protein